MLIYYQVLLLWFWISLFQCFVKFPFNFCSLISCVFLKPTLGLCGWGGWDVCRWVTKARCFLPPKVFPGAAETDSSLKAWLGCAVFYHKGGQKVVVYLLAFFLAHLLCISEPRRYRRTSTIRLVYLSTHTNCCKL